MRHRSAVGSRRLLDRHSRLERAVGEIRENGIRKAPHGADPGSAFTGRWRSLRRRWAAIAGRVDRPGGRSAGSFQKVATIHGPPRSGGSRTRRSFAYRGGMIAATTDEYHSPWLCTYDPRIHAIAVRRSFHFGITGRRLSNAELRVNGVNVHFPAVDRSPRNSS